jgi:hypothetical protein
MPIAAFKPMGVYKSSPWATGEWIVFNDSNGQRLRYWRINAPGTSFTALTDIAMPYVGHFSVGSNGTFVFVSGAGTPDCRQFAWNGSTLTQRHNGNPAAGGNGFAGSFAYTPNNSGRIIHGNASGICMWAFASAPTYAYTSPTATQVSGGGVTVESLADFRVGSVGVQGYGNTLVSCNQSTGQRFDAMTFSGSTPTSAANLTIANGGYSRSGGDRDTGLIVTRGSAAATVYMAQLNMTTRALSAIGNGTISGTTVICLAALGGFVIVYENSGNLRSYSRSGSTLTLVSTLALGGSPSHGFLSVSPYTNFIYLMSEVSGSSRVVSMSATGVLTSICTLTGVQYPSGGITSNNLVFLPAALPTV